jgi:putative flippase GtrA
MISKFNLNYILVGILNTILGYWIGIFFYFALYKKVGILGVGLITNFFNISISYMNYKILLFKTKGNIIKEYIKSFINYGFAGLLSIFLLWISYEIIHLNIFLSQLIALFFVVIFSYFGNKFFVFNNFNNK